MDIATHEDFTLTIFSRAELLGDARCLINTI